MIKNIFALALFAFSLPALAVVDTRSAGYTRVDRDFQVSGSGFELKIERANGSRSLYNGMFGYGWCSNFETRLDTLPGGIIRGVECGGGMEIIYRAKNQSLNIDAQVSSILAEVKKRQKLGKKTLKKLKKDLRQSQTLRSDFLTALPELKGKITAGVKYYANGRSSEYVEFKNNKFYRYLPNQVSEVFTSDGRLSRIYDKFGNYIDFTWRRDKVVVTDNKGRRLSLILNPGTGKVKEARFMGRLVAKYNQDDKEDLRSVTRFVKGRRARAFREYEYDGLHNLRKITFPDKTTEELSYDTSKDWVMSFKNRKNCKESYKYWKNPKNPNHYSSEVKKVCGRKIVSQGKYEFWNKPNPKGGVYLHRARSLVNGRLTDVIYHPDFGTPVSFLKNGVRTKREYYANGFLRLKSNPYREVTYKNYLKRCRKPKSVTVKTKDPSRKGKVVKEETITLHFRKNCYLRQVVKSKDEWIKVTPDDKGRLIAMEDQSRKMVKIKWSPSLNRPEVITRVGVGSIKLVYKRGTVVDVVGKSSPTIMAQVSSVFNTFLNTLSPVAEEMILL